MPNLFRCSNCAHSVTETARFCTGCGTPGPIARHPNSWRTSEPPEAITDLLAAERATQRVAAPPRSLSPIRVEAARQMKRGWPATRGRPNLGIIVTAVAALALGGWWWFYVPTTPSWAVYSLYRDVKDHDGAAAKQFIDFQSIAKAIIDAAVTEHETKNTPGEDEGQARLAEIFARGIAGLMVGPISDALTSRFAQWVDSRDEAKYPISLGAVLEAIVRLHRQGSAAFTQLTNDKGETLRITLTRENDADWKITSVDGKSIRDAIRESMENASKNTSAGSSSDESP
jgi:hypothetical protein